jgi:subfamily B ATP-binding cassette protein HlyB/CyaB
MSTTPSLPDRAFLALAMIARFHDISIDLGSLLHEFAEPDKETTYETLLHAAKSLHLKGRLVKRTSAALLQTLPLPALVKLQDGRYVVLAKIDAQHVLFQDPHAQQVQSISLEEWLRLASGEYLLFTSRASVLKDIARFDFSWFIPAVIKYRRVFSEVLGASLIIQLLALATPLFFQAVMDKVLVHRGMSTLDVIALGLLFVSCFEVILTALRTYLLSHTTNRIDVELGAKLFRHLIHLPISYFASRRAGESVSRVRELEHIREFITGQAMTALLDLVFAVIFILVMWHYSGRLTLIVLMSLPCYVLLTVTITPALRARVQEKSLRGAENQAFLVETIHGIETVKAMAVAPQITRQWDKQLAAYVSASFRVANIANWGSQAISLVQKIVVVATLWLGAKLVIDGLLTIGGLIAFNMLAGRVASPVMRLAQLWQDFQQTGVAVERLGDILNTPTERQPKNTALPAIQGDIKFQHITFQYRPDTSPVVNNLSLHIQQGEVIGIVGRSGSGKSTLTKLLQKLYSPQQGKLLIDDIDLQIADPNWLRRQLGVVQQEDFLFHRSIRDNIALSNPTLPLDQVIKAAQLAGAHDFIVALPSGYDTPLGEQGGGLSGGQKQRIAIARALITEPRILIFDEATSALDYESEHIIQRNMKEIVKGRTVLIIAHRLSAVRDANRIIVMDKGEIVEQGSHEELLSLPQGVYAYLHRLQQGGGNERK